MGVIIDGKDEGVPGLTIENWIANPGVPRLKRGEDCRQRFTRWVRGIVLHTTRGIPGGSDHRAQLIKPGLGPDRKGDLGTARFWATSAVQAGAHLVVDFDGSMICLADLRLEVSFHAGEVNEVTMGIEIFQGADAELYQGQLDAVVRLVDFLTRRFKIQRQFHSPYKKGPVPRIAVGALDVVGLYGHRDVTTNRGNGDPGDAIFQTLASAGYESFDFALDEDKTTWRQRQEQLNTDFGVGLTVDGVPGQKTAAALIASGRPSGLWVRRPGDPVPRTPEAIA
jgi:hypothetical protein